jgi:hypothetical protein
MANHEQSGWEAGDHTEQRCRAADWGDPPAYRVPATEWIRRLGLLDRRYRSVEVLDCGSSVGIDFFSEHRTTA